MNSDKFGNNIGSNKRDDGQQYKRNNRNDSNLPSNVKYAVALPIPANNNSVTPGSKNMKNKGEYSETI
jgi:hypothetical protein